MSTDPTLASSPEHEERCRLTRWLNDLDWDLGDRADVQDYLADRLAALGGPVPIAEAWGDA